MRRASPRGGGEGKSREVPVNVINEPIKMNKLAIIPHANAVGPVISDDVLKIGKTGLPQATERSIDTSKKKLAATVERSRRDDMEEERRSKSRERTERRALGAATSSIANMSAVIKDGGPFGPIASVLVPVLAASFAVYLYLSAGEGGVAIEGEKGKRTLFRWLDVIIGVVVAAAVLSFAR